MHGWGMRALWASVAVYAAVVAWAGTVLPDRVPLHWGASSESDRWGSRTEAVLTFAALGVFLTAMFVAMAWVGARASMSWLNIPHKDYWTQPEREATTRHRVVDDIAWIGVLSMVFIWALPIVTVQAARDPSHALPAWFFVVLVAWLVALLGYCVWMVAVRWKVPPQ